MDAGAVISRLAMLDQTLNGPIPVERRLDFNPGFARSPNDRGNFTIDSDEARNLLRAIGHG
jgi:hypothetical protein